MELKITAQATLWIRSLCLGIGIAKAEGTKGVRLLKKKKNKENDNITDEENEDEENEDDENDLQGTSDED
ncbi:hypothetical protein OUZ56_012521 [Daphnia magna]|uniref:Uncharacterized protein n=1 Tax=Daphnia magna TaxID=35525 RepID=A0ABQ9Z3C2_9CRUS|nr:hypothetical protein OUZ56_012521 [Daphnia magna]